MPPLSRSELIEMITAGGGAQEQLHAQAAEARDAAFGKTVVVRGVIELTNLCRVDCDYCPMRRANAKQNEVYLLGPDEILSAARDVRDAGVDAVVFQGGEVPQTTRVLSEVLPQVRELFGGRVEVLLGLGVKTEAEYRTLRARGANTYIVKHETADPALHWRIRHEPLDVRLRAIEALMRLGYRVGTGCIVGLPGQTLESLADDILLAQSLNVQMSSASPFVPTAGTPLAPAPQRSISRTLNVIAAMRLVNPRWLIPSVSALEQQSEGGQSSGFRAGANVITVNFTPRQRQKHYLIYGGTRHIVSLDHMRRQVSSAGLQPRGSIWLENEHDPSLRPPASRRSRAAQARPSTH
jgi:biotin synthase